MGAGRTQGASMARNSSRAPKPIGWVRAHRIFPLFQTIQGRISTGSGFTGIHLPSTVSSLHSRFGQLLADDFPWARTIHCELRSAMDLGEMAPIRPIVPRSWRARVPIQRQVSVIDLRTYRKTGFRPHYDDRNSNTSNTARQLSNSAHATPFGSSTRLAVHSAKLAAPQMPQ